MNWNVEVRESSGWYSVSVEQVPGSQKRGLELEPLIQEIIAKAMSGLLTRGAADGEAVDGLRFCVVTDDPSSSPRVVDVVVEATFSSP